MNGVMARTKSPTSPGLNVAPLPPHSIVSMKPPAAGATTGIPAAFASSVVRPKVSFSEKDTCTSAFEKTPGMLDKTYNFGDLKVFVDQASLLYLEGAEVDYVETLEGSGFKFNNPNVKSTCGCGSSFSA